MAAAEKDQQRSTLLTFFHLFIHFAKQPRPCIIHWRDRLDSIDHCGVSFA